MSYLAVALKPFEHPLTPIPEGASSLHNPVDSLRITQDRIEIGDPRELDDNLSVVGPAEQKWLVNHKIRIGDETGFLRECYPLQRAFERSFFMQGIIEESGDRTRDNTYVKVLSVLFKHGADIASQYSPERGNILHEAVTCFIMSPYPDLSERILGIIYRHILANCTPAQKEVLYNQKIGVGEHAGLTSQQLSEKLLARGIPSHLSYLAPAPAPSSRLQAYLDEVD